MKRAHQRHPGALQNAVDVLSRAREDLAAQIGALEALQSSGETYGYIDDRDLEELHSALVGVEAIRLRIMALQTNQPRTPGRLGYP